MTSTRPSATYLFDRQRTGRMLFSIGDRPEPELAWAFKLRSYPAMGAESSPVFDASGNIYFGSHDHCFYSLKSDGELRWMFATRDKVYSSPAVVDGERIIVASGDGNLLCFDKDGDLLWAYPMCGYFRNISGRLRRRAAIFRTKIKSYDRQRRKWWRVKCWSSANVDHGLAYITAYGLGLHAVDVETGRSAWTFDLGSPRYHLSGVALDTRGNIYVASQRRHLFSIDRNGKTRWSLDSGLDYDTWGNPSVDVANGIVFFPMTCGEGKGALIACTLDGQMLWKRDLPGGLRGTAAISHDEYVLLASLNGKLYFIAKDSSEIIRDVRLTKAQRGLWTTPSIDPRGRILITSKDSRHSGSLHCLDREGASIWRITTGKALSVPVVDAQGKVYFGHWNGEFVCYAT